MNKQSTSFIKTRVGRMLTLALPIGILFLSQACAPNSGPGRGRFIETSPTTKSVVMSKTSVSRINQ